VRAYKKPPGRWLKVELIAKALLDRKTLNEDEVRAKLQEDRQII